MDENGEQILELKKICKECGIEKSLEEFHKKKDTKDGRQLKCKVCRNIEMNQRRKDNPTRNKEINKKSREKYKEENSIKNKKYREENEEQIRLQRKEYRKNNKELISKRKKDYYEKNKDKIGKKKQEWEKEKRKTDPCFKLRKTLSRAVQLQLKSQGSSKGGKSILKYLPYTMQQLKQHLESQFDENMTWDNHGSYWHIDHIYPQSLLPFDSMEHENMLKSWALDNLRPLEASENIKKGNKIIENIEIKGEEDGE